jgi:hypothetical protein
VADPMIDAAIDTIMERDTRIRELEAALEAALDLIDALTYDTDCQAPALINGRKILYNRG